MKKLSIPITTALALSAGIISVPNISSSQDVADVIVVTVNRRPQPLSQIGSSVSVISEAELERNQQSFVLDALESVPGLAISQNGSFGGNANISIRGAGSANTVLLVDGVQLNDPSAPGGSFNFGTLDSYNISRIEVLRGPQSILYGSDAIGGVINIVTKTGEDGLGGKIFVEGGSFNTRRGGANIYGGNDQFGFNFSASSMNTDGISAADENDGNSESDGLDSYSFSGKVTAKLSEIFRLEGLGNYINSHSLYDSFGPVDGSLKQTSDSDQFSGVVRGHLDLFDDRFTNTLSVEYSKINRTLLGDFDPFIAKGKRTNIDYLGVFTVNSDWTMTGGLQHEKTKSEGNSESSFDISSVFGELAFTGVEGLVLTAGSRYDDHQTFGGHMSSRITASYTFEETGTKFLANWGEGFRAPSISQLVFECLSCSGINTELKPEQSFGYEFGVEQSLMDKKYVVSATYFYTRIKDKITFVNFTEGYDNVERTRSQGIELMAKAEITDRLFASASYTYTDAIDITNNVSTPLAREPKHLLSGSIQWNPTDKIATTLLVTHNGEETQPFGADPVEAWTRVDIRASYELMDDLSVYGRIDNVLNTEYQYIPGYGTPDRSFFAGLRKTF